MTIQQAIEKAIDGGYFPSYIRKVGKEKTEDILRNIRLADTFLDPLFWQSLGKAMGWEYDSHLESPYCWYYKGVHRRNLWGAEWEYNQHRFIDHLAEGKDAESFFETL